jgi:hypothetical protein
VQQSASGSIEISNVPRRWASAVISSLSIPISGRSTGPVATSSMRTRLVSVWEATCPRLSPVVRAWAPICRARISAIRTIMRR